VFSLVYSRESTRILSRSAILYFSRFSIPLKGLLQTRIHHQLHLWLVDSTILDTEDQFKWYGDFKDLICLFKTLLEFTEDGEISEDLAHNMFSFKVGDIIVKW